MKILDSIILISAVALLSITALAEKPNVVLIFIDDVGTGWIPPYAETLEPEDLEQVIVQAYQKIRGGNQEINVGKHIDAARNCMPFLSTLADSGMVFHRAFSTSNLCAPSRAGLLTGTYQQRWGAYRNQDIDRYGIPKDRLLISNMLKDAGYYCGMIGKWHVGPKDELIRKAVLADRKGKDETLASLLGKSAYRSSTAEGFHPLDRGFDYYFGFNSHGDNYYGSDTLWEGRKRVPKRPENEFLTELFNEKANTFIESALNDKNPFFLYYAPKTLHGAILPPPDKYASEFDTGVMFSNYYAGHLLALDEGIQRIYNTLEKHGQLQNTLFIFSSDNGCTRYNVPPHNAPNRGGKGTGWLGATNVPLIIYKPGLVQSGESNALVSIADLMPTILDTAGLRIPNGVDGKTLLPVLLGQASNVREVLYSSGLHASGWSWYYEANGELNKKDRNDSPLYLWAIEKDKVLLHLADTPPGLYESLPNGIPARTLFYDLKTDRHQLTDLKKDNLEIIERMNSGMHAWLKGMETPMTSQQEDYKDLLRMTDR